MAIRKNGLSREFIIHPGETLKEVLDDRTMSQKELAIRTDVTEAYISSIINGQKSISVSLAKKLEYALNVDASFWVNLQANYDKEVADFEEVNNISIEELDILKKLKDITSYLKEKGFIKPESQGAMLVIDMRKLLNISSLIQIPKIAQMGAYRLATSTKVDQYVLFTWLRVCELMIKQQPAVSKLDIDKLKKQIPEIKKLMYKDIEEITVQLKEKLAECGINFLFVKSFKGAPVQGLIEKRSDGSLGLIVTNRRKFADIFWFTFFHEIGHILNEEIKGKLVDYEYVENESEGRANKFAANVLIDSDRYVQFIRNKDFSLNSIKKFSAEQNIPHYIVIGRLQRDKYIKYLQYTDEKVKYEME